MDQVAQVREKIDIVSLLSEFLPLKKAGRNFKTNCPFHGEKTPSFVISPERQIWHCFGCNLGGDVFTFLMQYERLEFPEALRMLAQRAGVTLESRNFAETGIAAKKEKIYEINHIASEFYHYVLIHHPSGKKAFTYLTEERHILPQTINTFHIGFAPADGNALLQYLMKKKNYTREELFEAGLVTTRGSSLVDFFQGRVIFPLFDQRDNVTGFSGRVLTADNMHAKYINTRETAVYHKGRAFFGLNIAKEPIKKENQAIIVEGEFDVIACFQQGITNIVAIKGTALTEEQAALIGRYAQKITLCLDMDKAGQEAIKRSVVILEKKGLRTTVITPSSGKDADEAIKNNAIAFKKAVKNDIDVYEFLLLEALKKYDKTAVEGKRTITEILLPLYIHIENEIIKEHYINRLSKELGTSLASLDKEIERLEKKEVVRKVDPIIKTQKNREEVLEEYLLGLLVQDSHPVCHLDSLRQMMQLYKFHFPVYQKILDRLFVFCESHAEFDPKSFARTLPLELLPAFDQCFLLPLPKFTDDDVYKQEIQKITEKLYGLFIREQIKVMGETIKNKEKEGNIQELEELQKQLASLVSLLKKKQ